MSACGRMPFALRTGWARRRRDPSPGLGTRGNEESVSIHEWPADVTNPAVPGHLQGHLILGRSWKPQIATMVEHSTRFTLLVPLPVYRKVYTVLDMTG